MIMIRISIVNENHSYYDNDSHLDSKWESKW